MFVEMASKGKVLFLCCLGWLSISLVIQTHAFKNSTDKKIGHFYSTLPPIISTRKLMQ